MFCLGFLSLLVLACFAAASNTLVPGAYILEAYHEEDIELMIRNLSSRAKPRMEMKSRVFNGCSIQFKNVTDQEANHAALSLVDAKQIWPINQIPLPAGDIKPFKPNRTSLAKRFFWGWGSVANTIVHGSYMPHAMTQVDQLLKKGITGSGIRIAVIDTGIDYKHPTLGTTIGSCLKTGCGSCFGPGCLVEAGYDFVGDEFTGKNEPVPDKDPMDCNGHGTHVAGIISARKNDLGFLGAAPGAKLGAYKVFGCHGQSSDDVVVAATLQAFEDGADIITASLGAPTGWGKDPWGTVLGRLTDQGVPVVVAAGNEGSQGMFAFNGGGAGMTVTAVGSVDNRVIPLITIKSKWMVNKDWLSRKDFDLTSGDPMMWGVEKKRLWATNPDYDYTEDACNPLPENSPDLSKYVVLVHRATTCDFNVQVINILKKNAKYMIIYNFRDETFTPVPKPIPEGLLAVGMVDFKVGKEWIRKMNSGKKVHVTIPPVYSKGLLSKTTFANNDKNDKSGGLLSLYTSWGPTWDLTVKPQFTAPGGHILSTWPMEKGGFSVQSGTSMATPLVASVIALLYQVRGRIGLASATDLLSSTAKPQIFWNGTQRFPKLAPPAQQGAGLIQAYDAAYTTTRLYPSSLAFNDTTHLAESLNFTIMNYGKSSVIYTVSNVPAMTMYTMTSAGDAPMPFPNEQVAESAKLSFYHNGQAMKRVTLKADHRAIITVKATPPTVGNPERLAVWGGYIAVNGTDKSAYSMPYQGVAGEFDKAKVLRPDGAAAVVSVRSTQYVMPPPDTPIAMPGPGSIIDPDSGEVVLKLVVNLNLGTANLSVDIVPSGGDAPADKTKEVFGLKTLGQMYGFPKYLMAKSYSYHTWDGRLAGGKYVPSGKYYMNVRALKIMDSDPEKKESWDMAQTQPFEVVYS